MFQRWAVGLAAGARTGAVGVLERNARCRLAERNCERGNSLTHEIIRTVYKGGENAFKGIRNGCRRG